MKTTGPFSGAIDQTEIRFLVEKNADGIIVVDDDGIVLFANPAAEQIFGRASDALVGSPIGIPLIRGDTSEIAILRPGARQLDAEIRVVDTTWDHRPARLASLRDISARRAMEERLRHSAKMEAVGQLTAGIAHDFNNLLTVVLGNLESAQRQFASADASLLRVLDNAMRGARRAAVLTERLLAFARRKPLDPKILDPNALVRGMSDLLQRTLGERITVRTTLASGLWSTEADPTELETALLNLAVNARDAMPEGGELTIETANVDVDPADAAMDFELTPGSYVLISVTDSGTGMTPEVVDQAFEPLFTTKADSRGTGLGLSQVYGFAKQSGGHAKIYSELGIGTTVRLYLPRTAELDASPPLQTTDIAKHDRAPRAQAGETILVVEDDEDVRSYTVSSLRELGYRVFEAVDGSSAIEIVRREPTIGLLFTDLGLPGGIDGKALTEQARKIRPCLNVLITTAYAGSTLVHEGRLDPHIELLNKPFTFVALATRIRELLDRPNSRETPATVRILVVEDEPLLQSFLADTLADAGVEADAASSFGEALAKVRDAEYEFAAAIVDIGLPDRPGDELLNEIRILQPQLPVVLATGFSDGELRQRYARDQHVEVLAKPFDPPRLAAVLRALGVPVQLPT